MMKLIVIILAGSALFISGLFNVAAAEDINAKELFESKCSICHSIERPKSKKKTRTGWETTVMRMKNSNGAPITDEEAKIIIDYLAAEYGE